MESDQIDAFRKILLALKSELKQLQETGSEAAETVTLDQAKVGRLSRMDAMQAQQMAEETVAAPPPESSTLPVSPVVPDEITL